jgi:putative spermidine/putrescine transport system permease protein
MEPGDRSQVRYRSLTPALLLAPAMLLFLLFFVMPFVTLGINSFYDYGRMTGIIEVFTLKNYQRLLLDEYYLAIVGRTFRLSGTVALVTLLVGYPVALYLLVASARAKSAVIALILSPLLVSVIVRTFGWAVILGKNGLLEQAFLAIGIPGMDFLHTEAAVVVGLVNVLTPFVVLAVATSLQAMDPALPLAAASMGAGPLRVLWKVILPLSLPGVTAGMLIVFGLASASFVTPAVLGGAQFKVLSVVMYQQAVVLQNWPFAAAVAVTLLVIVLVIQGVQAGVSERNARRAMPL